MASGGAVSAAAGMLSLEARVSAVWGSGQFDWTVGRSPEGWFYYCGGVGGRGAWLHGGVEPTLAGALLRMIDLGSE